MRRPHRLFIASTGELWWSAELARLGVQVAPRMFVKTLRGHRLGLMIDLGRWCLIPHPRCQPWKGYGYHARHTSADNILGLGCGIVIGPAALFHYGRVQTKNGVWAGESSLEFEWVSPPEITSHAFLSSAACFCCSYRKLCLIWHQSVRMLTVKLG